MRTLGFLMIYGVAVAMLVYAKVLDVRIKKCIARRAARTLRMEARAVVCRDRYYAGRAADAINGFGRALAREGWELAP